MVKGRGGRECLLVSLGCSLRGRSLVQGGEVRGGVCVMRSRALSEDHVGVWAGSVVSLVDDAHYSILLRVCEIIYLVRWMFSLAGACVEWEGGK